MRYFKRKLDDKNRLTIPAELRDEFDGGKVILTRGFEDYLHLYSASAWENQMETALSGEWRAQGALPVVFDRELADLADRFLEGMVETTMDQKQGRITIDSELLVHSGLDRHKEVVATKMPGGYWRIKAAK